MTTQLRRLLVTWLLAALTLLACSIAMAEEAPRILTDKEFYTKGSFIAYAAPWSTYFGAGRALKHWGDYADEIAVRPETFPANVEFSWHWPLVISKHTGVYGCNAISFGSYDGGVPEVSIAPLQAKAIGSLSARFRYT